MIVLVELDNRPGALCAFLQTLVAVNLARIESRAVCGHPGRSFFLLDVETDDMDRMGDAERAAVQIRRLGAWPDTEHGWVVLMAPRIGDAG
jgi:prephenate dehydratase